MSFGPELTLSLDALLAALRQPLEAVQQPCIVDGTASAQPEAPYIAAYAKPATAEPGQPQKSKQWPPPLRQLHPRLPQGRAAAP